MVIIWVVLGFCLYVGAAIWWLMATANGWSSPFHIHSILNTPVPDGAQVLLYETLRVLVGGLFFYAVAEYVAHKATRASKKKLDNCNR